MLARSPSWVLPLPSTWVAAQLGQFALPASLVAAQEAALEEALEAPVGEEAPAVLTAWELAGRLDALEEKPGRRLVLGEPVTVWVPLLLALVSLLAWAPPAWLMMALQWCPSPVAVLLFVPSALFLVTSAAGSSRGFVCDFQPIAKRQTSQASHQPTLEEVFWVLDSAPQQWGSCLCRLPWKPLHLGHPLP